MAKTYLEIVNEVLLDTNEVPLTAVTFANARGFQAFVKGAVNRALMDIVNESDEWPWLANATLDSNLSQHTNEIYTERRKAVYEFEEEHSAVDWDSFLIEDLKEKKTYPLQSIQLEVWKRFRAGDATLNREEDVLDRPTFIIRTTDHSGFQVSDIPDKAYRITYTSWKAPSLLTAYDDTLPFADRFYNVLVLRAAYYAWRFRENLQQAGQTRGDYGRELANMKRILIRPSFQRMRPV